MSSAVIERLNMLEHGGTAVVGQKALFCGERVQTKSSSGAAVFLSVFSAVFRSMFYNNH